MNFKKRVNGSWHDIPHYIHKTATDTITTLPADIYANDTTATVGLKGNMQQSGTPSPTTPIQPQECGERTAQLFDYQTMAHGTDGMFLDENGNLQSSNAWAVTTFIPCNGSTFTLHKVGGGTPAICLYDAGKQFIIGKRYNTRGAAAKSDITIISQTNASYIRFSWYRQNDAAQDDLTTIMLNAGSEPLPFEPFGVKIPISSASTSTPIYLGEVETTRKIRKLVLTGNERFYGIEVPSTNTMIFNSEDLLNTAQFIPTVASFSTHYVYNPIQSGMVVGLPINQYALQYYAPNNKYNLLIHDSICTSVSAFQTYLQQQYAAGTPVTVWYVLATPETAVVNEPIRKIGNYADEVSGITIPTIAGANTLSVDTTLQPSEVTVNYKGWHTVADVRERDDGAWT